MTTWNNPNESDLFKRIEMLERILRANFLHSGSFGRGGITGYDGGRITLTEGGGLEITDDGFINIDGDLTGDGELTWEGLWKFLGDGLIDGDVDVNGILTILNDIIVRNNGRIHVGTNMTLTPTEAGGGITFADGPKISGGAGILGIIGGSSLSLVKLGTTETVLAFGAAIITCTAASITVSFGGRSLEITSTGFRFIGLPTKTAASTGLPVGVMGVESNGAPFRVTS